MKVFGIKDESLIILFFTIITAIILSLGIDSAFKWDIDGIAGSYYGTIARNYLRYGYLKTKFGMVDNGGIVTPSEYSFYTHHPPLPPLLISLSFKIFGIHEWSVRIVFMVFALGVLILLYIMAKELWSKRVAVWVCFFTILMPQYLHFSTVPNMVSVALFFCLTSVYSYIRLIKTKSAIFFTLMVISFFGATLSAWDSYYLIPAFFLNFSENKKRFGYLILVLGILSVCIYCIHTIILVGRIAIIANIKYVIGRIGTGELSEGLLSLGGCIKQILVWLWFFFTPSVIILAVIFLLMYFYRYKYLYVNSNVIIFFFIFGIIKYFLFLELYSYHATQLYYLIPFFSFSSALAVEIIYNTIKKPLIKNLFIIFTGIIIIMTVWHITVPVFKSLQKDDSCFFPDPKNKVAYNVNNEIIPYIREKFNANGLILTNAFLTNLKFYLDWDVKDIVSIEELKNILNYNQKYNNKIILFVFDTTTSDSKQKSILLEYLKSQVFIKAFNNNKWLVFKLTVNYSVN